MIEGLILCLFVLQLGLFTMAFFKLRKSLLFNPPEMIVGELKELPVDETPQKILQELSRLGGGLNLINTNLEKVPTRTLNTIQGSVNTATGKLGEMIQFLTLQQTYDRLMPVGNIVDFIGIRFPTPTDPGAIDFIDVKTGDKAVLNSDQKKLRAFVETSKEHINFKVVKVDIT